MVGSLYLSHVFDNSQQNSVRGIVTVSLCHPPHLHSALNTYKSGIIIHCHGPLSFHLIFRNVETCKCISIHSLSSACHTSNSCSFSSTHTHPIPPLFLPCIHIPFQLFFLSAHHFPILCPQRVPVPSPLSSEIH